MKNIGCDFETARFGPQYLAPKLICASYACRVPEQGNSLVGGVYGTGEQTMLDDLLFNLFSREGKCWGDLKIGANFAGYDMPVLVANYPQYMSDVFEALAQGKISCIRIREKLLNLADTGDLVWMTTPAGAKMKIEYSQAALEKKYLGRDRSAEKNASDAWRTNFAVLDGQPSETWPQEAVSYAIEDSTGAIEVWEAQQARAQQIQQETGVDPLKTEAFQVAVDFCLRLMTCWGVAIDPVEKGRIEMMLAEELSSEKLDLIIKAGILRPGSPARPNAKGAKEHVAGCPKRYTVQGPNGLVTRDCTCPVKMVAPVKASINEAARNAYVVNMVKAYGEDQVKLKYTAPSDNFPNGQLSVDGEWLEDHRHLDPVIEQMYQRSLLQKLVTTEIPRMNWEGNTSPVVHACFDVLKETGRTSSYADEKYPSFNGQNVDPRVRGCYIPRPGHVLFSRDYSGMELVTLAQKCLDLFGASVLADMLNKGVDVHAFLGAQIAYTLHPQFRQFVDSTQARTPEEIYCIFVMYEEAVDEESRSFYKMFRKWAKPTGLGYPGGLAAETFIAYSKKTYGVVVDLQTAQTLKQVWMQTYPEMAMYFDWIKNGCEDTRNGPRRYKDTKTGHEKTERLYGYLSPMGMLRSGASYCAAANGAGLQTPGAEGAKLGVYNVMRACYDPEMGSVLGGGSTRPSIFIHDEIFGEMIEDGLMHERMIEMGRIMVESMRVVTPGVVVKTEGCLMRRWCKDAKPVFDAQGRLTVWEPKK